MNSSLFVVMRSNSVWSLSLSVWRVGLRGEGCCLSNCKIAGSLCLPCLLSLALYEIISPWITALQASHKRDRDVESDLLFWINCSIFSEIKVQNFSEDNNLVFKFEFRCLSLLWSNSKSNRREAWSEITIAEYSEFHWGEKYFIKKKIIDARVRPVDGWVKWKLFRCWMPRTPCVHTVDLISKCCKGPGHVRWS